MNNINNISNQNGLNVEAMDGLTLEMKQLQKEFQDVPTAVKVVFVKICDKTIIDRQDYSFTLEDDARYFAEDVAKIEVGVDLYLWESCHKSIANIYTFTDRDDIFPMKYRILIYPVEK